MYELWIIVVCVEKIVSKAGIYKCQASNEYNETAQGIEIISVHPTSMGEYIIFETIFN